MLSLKWATHPLKERKKQKKLIGEGRRGKSYEDGEKWSLHKSYLLKWDYITQFDPWIVILELYLSHFLLFPRMHRERCPVFISNCLKCTWIIIGDVLKMALCILCRHDMWSRGDSVGLGGQSAIVASSSEYSSCRASQRQQCSPPSEGVRGTVVMLDSSAKTPVWNFIN